MTDVLFAKVSSTGKKICETKPCNHETVKTYSPITFLGFHHVLFCSVNNFVQYYFNVTPFSTYYKRTSILCLWYVLSMRKRN